MNWWEIQPKEVMSRVYWLKDQLPPTGSKGRRAWKNIVRQLIVKYPPPDDYIEEDL